MDSAGSEDGWIDGKFIGCFVERNEILLTLGIDREALFKGSLVALQYLPYPLYLMFNKS